MDNQHRKIKGYRELSQSDIDLMNEGKDLAEQCRMYIENLQLNGYLDHQAISHGQTLLQTGFMWIIRGIAQPESF